MSYKITKINVTWQNSLVLLIHHSKYFIVLCHVLLKNNMYIISPQLPFVQRDEYFTIHITASSSSWLNLTANQIPHLKFNVLWFCCKVCRDNYIYICTHIYVYTLKPHKIKRDLIPEACVVGDKAPKISVLIENETLTAF